MARVRIDFQRRGKSETFSRSRVQPMGNGIQLTLGIPKQIRALPHVLTQQAISMLVGAALPGAVRLGNEHLDREAMRQPLIFRHLFAPIVGQRFPQRTGDMSELLHESPVRTIGIHAVHSSQQHQPRGPFHQGAHDRAIAGAFQQVAFLVAWHGPGSHVGRPFGDWSHIGNLAPAVSASRPGAAGLASLPQAPPRQHVQCARVEKVDAFTTLMI